MEPATAVAQPTTTPTNNVEPPEPTVTSAEKVMALQKEKRKLHKLLKQV